MLQSKAQSGQQLETAVEIDCRQLLTPLSVIFCGQVPAFQYFSQIEPYRTVRKLFKAEIL
jgi:hypothetical protein